MGAGAGRRISPRWLDDVSSILSTLSAEGASSEDAPATLLPREPPQEMLAAK
jgi:hypothetical protein